MQDWTYNNIINISEKYYVVQIPRVPQGILKKGERGHLWKSESFFSVGLKEISMQP